MAFPYIFEDDFESGDNSGWNSETDSSSQLDFPHYTTLAEDPGNLDPYQGAYSMRAVITGTSDAFVQANAMDIGNSETRWVRFAVKVGADFLPTSNDTVVLYELQSSGGTVELAVGLSYVNGDLHFGIHDASPGSNLNTALNVQRGKWYTLEVRADVDTGTNGSADLYVTREDEPPSETVFLASTGTPLDAVIVQGVLGVQDQSATTTGTLLFDQVAFDDARLYPKRRWTVNRLMTKSGHVFVGPGKIETVSLLSGGSADNVLEIYDTDQADTNDLGRLRIAAANDASSQTVQVAGAEFHRGAYVSLSGTNPRALVDIAHARVFGSTGAYRTYGVSPS